MPFSVFVKYEPFLDIDVVLSGVAYQSAEIIRDKIQDLMRERKTGIPYRHKDGAMRPASASGEAPGIDSGDLIGSFEILESSVLEAQLTTDVEYGIILQENRNRLFTEPAIEAAEAEIIELVEDRIFEKWQ